MKERIKTYLRNPLTPSFRLGLATAILLLFLVIPTSRGGSAPSPATSSELKFGEQNPTSQLSAAPTADREPEALPLVNRGPSRPVASPSLPSSPGGAALAPASLAGGETTEFPIWSKEGGVIHNRAEEYSLSTSEKIDVKNFENIKPTKGDCITVYSEKVNNTWVTNNFAIVLNSDYNYKYTEEVISDHTNATLIYKYTLADKDGSNTINISDFKTAIKDDKIGFLSWEQYVYKITYTATEGGDEEDDDDNKPEEPVYDKTNEDGRLADDELSLWSNSTGDTFVQITSDKFTHVAADNCYINVYANLTEANYSQSNYSLNVSIGGSYATAEKVLLIGKDKYVFCYRASSDIVKSAVTVNTWNCTVTEITYNADKDKPINNGNEGGDENPPSDTDDLGIYTPKENEKELNIDSNGSIPAGAFTEQTASECMVNVYTTLNADYDNTKKDSYVTLTLNSETEPLKKAYYLSSDSKQSLVFCFEYKPAMSNGFTLTSTDCAINKVTYDYFVAEENPDKNPDDSKIDIEAKRSWLITNHSQLTASAGTEDVAKIGLYDDDYSKDKNLADVVAGKGKTGGSTTDPWMITATPDTRSVSSDPYLEIDLGDGINLGNDDLVVFTKRHIADRNDHPTGLRIAASTDGSTFETIGHAYFIYRGHHYMSRPEDIIRGTKEYSERIQLDKDVRDEFNSFTKLRVYFIENNNKKNETYRLACFNIMRVDPKENYSDVLIDRFHLVTDYDYQYYNYDFIPTLGIFNEHNQYHNGFYKNMEGYFGSGISDTWTGNEKDGYIWKNDKDWLELAGVEIPEYKFFTNANDSRISTSPTVLNSKIDNKRQPVHEQEHILYALPGEPIALYPYSQIQELRNTEYAVTFYHWYDYRTGGSSPYLDFLIDPTLVTKSKNFGYFGGEEFVNYAKSEPVSSGGETENNGYVPISSADDYIQFVEDFNNGDKNYANNRDLVIKLLNDIDLNGKDIAPIGATNDESNVKRKFCGTFDGQGYTIKNFKMTNSTVNNTVGMFGYVGGGAIIKNFTLDSSCQFYNSNNQGLVIEALGGYAYSSNDILISNIVFSAAFNKNNYSNPRLFIANCQDCTNLYITIKDCVVTSNISGSDVKLLGHFDYATKATFSNILFLPKLDTGTNATLYSAVSCPTSISNCYVPISGLDMNELKTDDEGKYYFIKGSDKIYVNSQAFADLLNGADSNDPSWIFIDGESYPKPFAQIINKTPDEGDGGNTETPPAEEEDVRTNIVENLDEIETKLFKGQEDNPIKRIGTYKTENNKGWGRGNDYKVATVATFFYPRPTNNETLNTLPPDKNSAVKDDKDYIFAADLSCIFNQDANLDTSEKSIYEPTITFRHLFRIKDGAAFAEEFSGSAEDNQNYVERHRRIVSAPSDKTFQIRLDNPVPVQYKDKTSAPMDLYYKAGENDYRRIRGCKIEIYEAKPDGTPGTKLNTDKFAFAYAYGTTLDSKYSGLGNRMYENTKYQICDDDAEYYRMLFCQNPSEGRFLVRLIGLDINGDPIKVYGSDEELRVSEFDITFLSDDIAGQTPLKGANGTIERGQDGSLSNDENLFLEDEINESKYGKPLRIDFDRYRYVTIQSDNPNDGVKYTNDYVVSVNGNLDNSYFKWPLPWDISTYGFPYSTAMDALHKNNVKGSQDYNYNIYMLANNGSALNYNAASGGLKDIHYLRSLYKNTLTNTVADQGFFYWVNAAADPGTAASIRLEDLCTGSTIHVTGWLTDTSGSTDKCNMAFNLVAVREDGIREVIHTFVTGDIAEGNWKKIRYEFTPNYSRIHRIISENPIDHYELELESNAKGSIGADYALDEIRMYVAKPVVEAKQITPICEGKQTTVDVKVRMPFEPLLSYLGESEFLDGSSSQKSPNQYYSPTQRASATPSDLTIYYTFLDEAVFNKYYRSEGYKAAFEKAQLTYNYSQSASGRPEKYGTLTFSNQFSKNETYPMPTDTVYYNKAYAETEDLVRYIAFKTRPEIPEDGSTEVNYLIPGHKYIIGIVLKTNSTLSDGSKFMPDYRDFDIMNSCSNVAPFEVESANKVVFTNDGEKSLDGTFCLGATPTVSVDLKAHSKSGLELDLTGDYFDWYAGSSEEYEKQHIKIPKIVEGKEEEEDLYLSEALAAFRNKYPNAESADLSDSSDTSDLSDEFKQKLAYIKSMTEKKHSDGRQMLSLHEKEYKFNPLVATVTDSINVVTAIPISKIAYENATIESLYGDGSGVLNMTEKEYNALGTSVSDSVTVCLSPIEIQLKVSSNAPWMFHGFKDITYPSEIASVPIRIGLRQIQQTWGSDDKEKTKALRIPVKQLSAPTELAAGLKTGNKNDKKVNDVLVYVDPTTGNNYNTSGWLFGEPVYLVDSDDPQFDPNDSYPIVGQVVDMKADKSASDNAFYVRFDGLSGLASSPTDRYYDFREGYYYTMRFNIQEYGKSSSFAQNSCPGQHFFTIKVVPEYVKWNGGSGHWGRDVNTNTEVPLDPYPEDDPDEILGASKNWNDDANWLRVDPSDILPANDMEDAKKTKKILGYGKEIEAKGNAIADYKSSVSSPTDANDYNLVKKFTTGFDSKNTGNSTVSSVTDENPGNHQNPNRMGFVPMDFTKVVMAPGVPFPTLYKIDKTPKDGNDWSQLSDLTFTRDPITGKRIEEDKSRNEDIEFEVGDYGHNIHYDMMVTDAAVDDYALTTRPWYANKAKFIHFKPDTELGGQAYLDYEKAWVDMELNSQRWYTVASPLKNVYAGDMYLPKDGARQVSPLFEPVKFKQKYDPATGLLVEGLDVNHRFAPAVYQRSWNLAQDWVYEFEGEENNVYRSINWSHVYNDVKVKYAPGEGFSIKSDVTDAENIKEGERVLFRFPKEDTEYAYYAYDEELGKKGADSVDKPEEEQGRFNPVDGTITITANEGSRFFLVGNPFMSHIDMQRFLKANQAKIEPKYWIINGDNYSAFILEDNNQGLSSGYEEVEIYLPPMAGFFVEVKSKEDNPDEVKPGILETTEIQKKENGKTVTETVPALKLAYTEDMSITYGNAGENWLSQGPKKLGTDDDYIEDSTDEGGNEDDVDPQSRAASPRIIRISAGRDGWRYSSAVIRVGERFNPGFAHAEDAELLMDPNILDRSLVYTIAGGNALSINSTPDAYGTEIGVIADGGARTTLLFEGDELDNGYMLYDALTGEVSDLYAGFRYEVEGNVASRLFLSEAPAVEAITGLRIEKEGHEVSVVPAAPDMEVAITVCDIAGMVVKDFTAKGATRFRLDDGVYIVTATAADSSSARAKLLLR